MRQITASDLMYPSVLTVRDTMTVRELAVFLTHHEITGAPVKNRQGKLVGVVSVVDVTRAVGEEEAAAEEDASVSGERANPEPRSPGDDQSPEESTPSSPFHERGLDAGRKPAPGQRLGPREMDEKSREDDEVLVCDIMSSGVFSVSEDATVSEIASAMLDSHLHRILVTRNGEPIGIITTSDLLGLLVNEED